MSRPPLNTVRISFDLIEVIAIFLMAGWFVDCWSPGDNEWSKCRERCHGQPQSVTAFRGCGCFPPVTDAGPQ